MIDFNLPDIGEGLQEAEIVKWLVKPGDSVEIDQVLVEIETDKAVVEVPSPQKGTIAKLHGKPGDVIKVGNPLVSFEAEGTEVSAKEDSGTVVGKIESGSRIIKESPTGISSVKSASGSIRATPAIRNLAAKLNVDLNQVAPTGPGGTISKKDVESLASSNTTREEPVSFSASPNAPEGLKRARRTMARNMAASHSQVALVTLMDDADITHWSDKEDLTARMAFAIAAASRAEPSLNAFYNHENETLQKMKEVHLGLAVDTPDGLYVPVMKNVEKRDATGIRNLINSFKQKAREKAFQPEDLKGGTIILSNYGAIGGRYATPMVVPPMVAIIGVGRTHQELALVVNRPVVRLKLPISLSFDHRAATGGEASRFLSAMIKSLEA